MVILRVQEYAIKKGITTGYQLAKVTGLSRKVAYPYFNNAVKRPDLDILNRICEGLKLGRNAKLIEYIPDEE